MREFHFISSRSLSLVGAPHTHPAALAAVCVVNIVDSDKNGSFMVPFQFIILLFVQKCTFSRLQNSNSFVSSN